MTVSQPKVLYVLRHAKSSWDDQLLPDHDRPLSQRGRKAVRLLGEHLREIDLRPALVLCSSARRTQDTLRGVLGDYPAEIEPELYGASCKQLIERLSKVGPDLASLMVIGHNPALQMLVLKLATKPGASPLREDPESWLAQIERKFPTGALATLELKGEWAELMANGAKLVDYIRPKALA
jgi:phosphohistidine phosphatase